TLFPHRRFPPQFVEEVQEHHYLVLLLRRVRGFDRRRHQHAHCQARKRGYRPGRSYRRAQTARPLSVFVNWFRASALVPPPSTPCAVAHFPPADGQSRFRLASTVRANPGSPPRTPSVACAGHHAWSLPLLLIVTRSRPNVQPFPLINYVPTAGWRAPRWPTPTTRMTGASTPTSRRF